MAAQIVSKLLNFEMLTTCNEDPNLIKMVITGDKSWVYSYDIETKIQSSQWNRPEESVFRIVKNRRTHQNTTNLFICQKQTDNADKQMLSTYLVLCANITERKKKIKKGKPNILNLLNLKITVIF